MSHTSSTFEPLESRQLMSVSLDGGGNLTVKGTRWADNIEVSQFAKLQSVGRYLTRTNMVRVVENGTVTYEGAASRVKQVTVFGDDGNDVITAKAGTIPAVVYAGGGSDTVATGDGNDFVAGDNQWVNPFNTAY